MANKTLEDLAVEQAIADFRRYKFWRRLQVGLLVGCYGSLAAAIAAKLMTGTPATVIALGLGGTAFALASFVPGRKADRTLALAQMVQKAAHEADLREASQSAMPPAPLTVCFANFSGPEMEAWVAEDKAALAGLFAIAIDSDGRQQPRAQVLFVYTELAEDGTINGPVKSDIRTVAQLYGAQVVVLASPNPTARVQAAVMLPGPKAANIVMTLARNGPGFGQFFAELFGRMRAGTEMLAAWVALAPQGPAQQQSTAPATLLLAEAGKLAFPTHGASRPG